MSAGNRNKVDWNKVEKKLYEFYQDEAKASFKDKKIRKLLNATNASDIIYSKSKIKDPKIDGNLNDYEKFFLDVQIKLTRELRRILITNFSMSKKKAKRYSAGPAPTAKSNGCKGWAKCVKNPNRKFRTTDCPC